MPAETCPNKNCNSSNVEVVDRKEGDDWERLWCKCENCGYYFHEHWDITREYVESELSDVRQLPPIKIECSYVIRKNSFGGEVLNCCCVFLHEYGGDHCVLSYDKKKGCPLGLKNKTSKTFELEVENEQN
jgi:hypothetical protein